MPITGTTSATPDTLTQSASASEAVYTFRDRLADYRVLSKPSITRMVVITAAIGFALAARSGHAWTWLGLVGTLAGTALSCMAAGVFNMIIERRTDALMPRTAKRPLATGRLPVSEALCLGIAFMLGGQGLLCLLGSPLASGLAAFTIFSYALMYTPLKRVSTKALYLGAIPGAMPPLIGYAAVTESLAASAWVIFGIMFIWQIPHFLAIGYMYRDDYAKADMAMHAVRDPSGGSSKSRSILWCVLLIATGAMPLWLGFAGWVSFVVVLLCGLWFLYTAIGFARETNRVTARRMFFASLIYLPVVLTAIMVDAK